MNKFARISFFLSIISANATGYASKVFGSSLPLDKETLLLGGLEKVEESKRSKLVIYKLSTKEKRSFLLPEKYKNRAIRALIKHTELSKFFVVTQWQRGDLDDPQIHIWNSTNNLWEDLGSLKCRIFKNLEVKAGEIKLICHSEKNFDKKGRATLEPKIFSHKDIQVSGIERLPYELPQISGLLENELRIKMKDPKKTSIVLKAEEIF